MKKITILISALGLAACGGGGSNHSGGSTVYVPPRPAVTSAVAASNAQITNLPSEVVVASNSSAPINVVGSVTTISGGVTYTSYRLDDVKLFTAENLDTTGRSYVNLELNNDTGEVDAVKMVVGGAESNRTVRDTTDTTTFVGPVFEYVPDGDDQAVFRVVDNGQNMAALDALVSQNSLPTTGHHWNRVDERMVFSTHGNDVGLQYADFGYFNPVYRSKNKNLTTDDQITAARAGTLNRSAELDKYRDDEQFNAALTKEDYQLFAGGYAIEGTTMVDTLTPENNTAYTGKAIGRVYTSIQGANRDAYLAEWDVPSGPEGHDLAKAYTTTAATLVVGDDGRQILHMPFDTFYDVTVTQLPGDTDPTFTFTGTPSEAVYRRNTAETNIEKDFNPGYYGVNTPVEATGTVRYYTEQELGTDATREWKFQAAYGMKKD